MFDIFVKLERISCRAEPTSFFETEICTVYEPANMKKSKWFDMFVKIKTCFTNKRL